MLGIVANRRLAVGIGVVLPLAEMVRRSADLGSWWLWIDDWLIGAALLLGAWYSRGESESGLRALAAAWGLTSGMGYYSFGGHLLRRNESDVSSLPGWAITAVVGLGTLIAIYATLSSITHRAGSVVDHHA
jgi:hypothetical protein